MRLPGCLSQLKATRSDGFGILLVYIGAKLKTFERGPMALRRLPSSVFCVLALTDLCFAAAPLRAQVPRAANFLADHYDASASLDAIGQSISATAKVDFKAVEASSSVRVELHPNLIVKDVKGPDAKPLHFERDSQNPLVVIAQLPTPVATDGHVILTYTYAGLLVNEENSPVPGVRAAFINKDGAYLLLPARWFPLTNFPSNRYTATFRLNVPDSFAVAGTGKASAPSPMAGKNAVEGGRLLYTFECKNPAPHGTFVVGKLQLNPKQAEGINVAVYAPKASSANAAEFAASVARSAIIFSDMFGPIPDPTFTLIQIPDGTLRDFAAPRSEEHTSELQSQSNLVCRLLLEKKNKIRNHPAAYDVIAYHLPLAQNHFLYTPSSKATMPSLVVDPPLDQITLHTHVFVLDGQFS